MTTKHKFSLNHFVAVASLMCDQLKVVYLLNNNYYSINHVLRIRFIYKIAIIISLYYAEYKDLGDEIYHFYALL